MKVIGLEAEAVDNSFANDCFLLLLLLYFVIIRGYKYAIVQSLLVTEKVNGFGIVGFDLTDTPSDILYSNVS